MKICIVGASGKPGRHMMQHALDGCARDSDFFLVQHNRDTPRSWRFWTS